MRQILFGLAFTVAGVAPTMSFAADAMPWDDAVAYMVVHKMAETAPDFEKTVRASDIFKRADQFDKADVLAREVARLKEEYDSYTISDEYRFLANWRLSDYNSFNSTFTVEGLSSDSWYTWSTRTCDAFAGCSFSVCTYFNDADDIATLHMQKEEAKDFYRSVHYKEDSVVFQFKIDKVEYTPQEQRCQAKVFLDLTSAKLKIKGGAPILDLVEARAQRS